MFGLYLILSTSRVDLGIFIASLAIYHLLEYVFVWKFHPEDASYRCTNSLSLFCHSYLRLAFLFTPHEYYPYAILFAFAEYFFELLFFPSLKGHSALIFLGFIGLVVGQIFRTGMFLSELS